MDFLLESFDLNGRYLRWTRSRVRFEKQKSEKCRDTSLLNFEGVIVTINSNFPL